MNQFTYLWNMINTGKNTNFESWALVNTDISHFPGIKKIIIGKYPHECFGKWDDFKKVVDIAKRVISSDTIAYSISFKLCECDMKYNITIKLSLKEKKVRLLVYLLKTD